MSGLRRAEDADVHPMLVEDDPAADAAGAPAPGSPLAAASTASGGKHVRPGKPAKPGKTAKQGETAKSGMTAKQGETGKLSKPAKSSKTAKPGKDTKSGKRAASGEGRARAGAGKRVDLKASVPKRLRTRVREMARRRGVSPDEVVEQILEAALDER
jgi:hypothetical protein